MPRRRQTSLTLDRPRLVPHPGLPGQEGTRRFAYSFETSGGPPRDAFKVLPLLPTPLTATAAATGGEGAGRAGGAAGDLPPSVETRVGATIGDTSGVQGMAKGWSPTTGEYIPAATGGEAAQ